MRYSGFGIGILAIGLALGVAGAASAGLNDPIPAPFTKQPFNVPGVINDGVVTVISCSSGLSTAVNVGVEWFKKDGTSIGVSSLSVAAGSTVNFGSASLPYLGIDAVMFPQETIKSGSARVLSTTSSGVFCNAFVMDPANDPPQRMMQLLITGVKKQKGQ